MKKLQMNFKNINKIKLNIFMVITKNVYHLMLKKFNNYLWFYFYPISFPIDVCFIAFKNVSKCYPKNCFSLYMEVVLRNI